VLFDAAKTTVTGALGLGVSLQAQSRA